MLLSINTVTQGIALEMKNRIHLVFAVVVDEDPDGVYGLKNRIGGAGSRAQISRLKRKGGRLSTHWRATLVSIPAALRLPDELG
jgi:hypothetical protein